MPSIAMRVVALQVRLTRKRRYATREAGLAFLHSVKGSPKPPRGVLRACHVTVDRVQGVDVVRVRRAGRAGHSDGVVLYLSC